MTGSIAGHDMKGKALYVLLAEFSIQKENHGPRTRMLSLGMGSEEFMPSQYDIDPERYNHCLHESCLTNLDQLQWIKVTLQTVQRMARMRGVQLSGKGIRPLYACRMPFNGWTDRLAEERRNDARFKEYVNGAPTALLPGSYQLGSRAPIFCYGNRCNSTLDGHASFELLCYRYA